MKPKHKKDRKYRDKDNLTPKQELFCDELCKDLNATRAAIDAGYSPKSARSQASQLIHHPGVVARLNELTQKRRERLELDADYVLKQALTVHTRCMQKEIIYEEVGTKEDGTKIYEPKLDDDGNTVFEFDSKGALKSLEIIGKHSAVNAFIKTVNINDVTPIEKRIQEARARAFAYRKSLKSSDPENEPEDNNEL